MPLPSSDRIAQQARASLSPYCINECKAYCCRKGYLVIPSEEAAVVAPGKGRPVNGKISIDLEGGCPSLKDFKCTVYEDRPQVCRDFPVFLEEKTVRLSQRCPAVREGKLYPYVAQLVKLGFKIGANHPYATVDISALFLSQSRKS